MTVLVSLLRGVNLGTRRVKMEALRTLYESLGLRQVETHVQSGNVVFKAAARDVAKVARRIEQAIESTFGFQSDVIVRTAPELRDIVAANPFAKRSGINPSKLVVVFLDREPSQEAKDKLLSVKIEPEELRIHGREIYIYYPNGQARPKLPPTLIDRTLKSPATGRNWNTVTKLLEIADALEARD